MIYPQNFEQKIGFSEIRRMLSDGCLSILGKEKVDGMAFSSHFEEVTQQPESGT